MLKNNPLITVLRFVREKPIGHLVKPINTVYCCCKTVLPGRSTATTNNSYQQMTNFKGKTT